MYTIKVKNSTKDISVMAAAVFLPINLNLLKNLNSGAPIIETTHAKAI